MKILSMTATFGKLERQSLRLQPGLNIIEAPNEWGKSTWCAFIAAMLYGVDTRERSTADHLADKEHYAPWSGSPMSGRMDICWNGRNITIERSTRGRVPMGHFRAYETATGLDVPELSAANCGSALLGVERSVFLRTAFLRLSDMPVTQDDALRTRLNALVTTGDESNTATMLGSKLRELKNSCRYNRSGLLPQAEAEKAALEQKLEEIDALQAQHRYLTKQIGQLEERTKELENHRDALEYKAAQLQLERLEAARNARQTALQKLENLAQLCGELPARETLETNIFTLQQLHHQLSESIQAYQSCSVANNTPAQTVQQAEADSRKYTRLRFPLFLILTVLALIFTGCAGLLLYLSYEVGIYLLPLGAALSILFLAVHLVRQRLAGKLAKKYGSSNPIQWINEAQSASENAQTRQTLAIEIHSLRQQILAITDDVPVSQCIADWQEDMRKWDQLWLARLEYRQSITLEDTLSASIIAKQAPALPDTLEYSPVETFQLLTENTRLLRQLEAKLGQCQGQLDQLGNREALTKQLEQVKNRISKLQETEQALILAQQALEEARSQLQRRFAPQITARARQIIAQLTDQRYDRITLDNQLNLLSGAKNEDVLHSALWRSDGTADQLYLALRLAVSQALIPDAPLILDDALVRFDDIRLKAALNILKEESHNKQVIIFTCQSREKNLI